MGTATDTRAAKTIESTVSSELELRTKVGSRKPSKIDPRTSTKVKSQRSRLRSVPRSSFSRSLRIGFIRRAQEDRMSS